jgi:hypothetical protein
LAFLKVIEEKSTTDPQQEQPHDPLQEIPYDDNLYLGQYVQEDFEDFYVDVSNHDESVAPKTSTEETSPNCEEGSTISIAIAPDLEERDPESEVRKEDCNGAECCTNLQNFGDHSNDQESVDVGNVDSDNVIKENCPDSVLSWLLAKNPDINANGVLCNPIAEHDGVAYDNVSPNLSNEEIPNKDESILTNTKIGPFFVDFDGDPRYDEHEEDCEEMRPCIAFYNKIPAVLDTRHILDIAEGWSTSDMRRNGPQEETVSVPEEGLQVMEEEHVPESSEMLKFGQHEELNEACEDLGCWPDCSCKQGTLITSVVFVLSLYVFAFS